MNMTYVRVGLYFLAPLLGALPGIHYDGGKLVTVNIEEILFPMSVAAAGVGAIFAKWGKK